MTELYTQYVFHSPTGTAPWPQDYADYVTSSKWTYERCACGHYVDLHDKTKTFSHLTTAHGERSITFADGCRAANCNCMTFHLRRNHNGGILMDAKDMRPEDALMRFATVEEAREDKWQYGLKKYGPEGNWKEGKFIGHPLSHMYSELIDALNYNEAAHIKGLISDLEFTTTGAILHDIALKTRERYWQSLVDPKYNGNTGEVAGTVQDTTKK